MKLIIVTAIFVACVLHHAKGSCLSYGHSCWGAHGKRSGNSASTDDTAVVGTVAMDPAQDRNHLRPLDQLSLAQRWALFNQRNPMSPVGVDAPSTNGNDDDDLQRNVNGLGFGLSVADIRALHKSLRLPDESKRAFATSMARNFAGRSAADDETAIGNESDLTDADDTASKYEGQNDVSERLFGQMSPRLRRFLLGQTN